MKQSHFSIYFSLILFLSANGAWAQSQVAAISDVDSFLEENQILESTTVAAPLFTERLAEFAALSLGESLLTQPLQAEHAGKLSYEPIHQKGFRVQFHNLTQPSTFLLKFAQPVRLSNRWLLIRYAGSLVPSHLLLNFISESRQEESLFDLYPENSTIPKTIFIKLPDTADFFAVEAMQFIADPATLKIASADFWILDIQVLPANMDPLQNATDFSRFDWFQNPSNNKDVVPSNKTGDLSTF